MMKQDKTMTLLNCGIIMYNMCSK